MKHVGLNVASDALMTLTVTGVDGGLVIAAHANGANGVITETLRMGTSGQARIAATQHPALHALEFVNFYTDHEKFTSPGLAFAAAVSSCTVL